jgi:predicted small metal-binding protein
METCPGKVTAETEEEIIKLIEVHAVVAHGEDPTTYSEDDWAHIKTFIKSQ